MSMRANSHQNGASSGHSAPKGDPRVAASGRARPLSLAVICGSGLWQPAPQGPTPPARQPWRDPLKSRHTPSPRVLGRRATTLCGLSGLCWIFWAPGAARSDGTRQGLLPPGRPLAFGQRLIECLRQGLGQIAKDRALARLNFSRRRHTRLNRHPLAGAR